MKSIFNKISSVAVIALVFGFLGCESYEEYIKDYDYTAVYFGAQQPVRTLVSRTGNEYLEFKIGVALGGVRENKKGYSAQFMIDPALLDAVEGAEQFELLPQNCYSIENANHTFVIPKGKFLGDCPVKINKNSFAALPGSLVNTYALPLRLLNATTDSVAEGKDFTVIVIKYIDEHSGYYYCKGSQSEWDGSGIVPGTTEVYSIADLNKNKIRLLTTLSLIQFDMAGMGVLGNANGTAAAVDHLLINLVSGVVTLETNTGSSVVKDRGSSYNADTKTFTLEYIYTKGEKSYVVNEQLILRQDVEKELRFETW